MTRPQYNLCWPDEKWEDHFCLYPCAGLVCTIPVVRWCVRYGLVEEMELCGMWLCGKPRPQGWAVMLANLVLSTCPAQLQSRLGCRARRMPSALRSAHRLGGVEAMAQLLVLDRRNTRLARCAARMVEAAAEWDGRQLP